MQIEIEARTTYEIYNSMIILLEYLLSSVYFVDGVFIAANA